MIKSLVVSRACNGAGHCQLTKTDWRNLETLNHQAMSVVTGLPKLTPIGKLR